jgi:hypothetical protein
MNIKKLIKILQGYNQNAEVRVVTDRQAGETAPATIVCHFDTISRLGFASAFIDEEKLKRESKKVVIS